MRFEFDGNGFSADMNSGVQRSSSPFDAQFIEKYLGFMLSCISLVLSLSLMGLYVLFPWIRDVFLFWFGGVYAENMVLILIPYFTAAIMSIVFGISSIVICAKNKAKSSMATVALIFSIVAFCICVLFLVLSTILIIAP